MSDPSTKWQPPLSLTKLDVARRQLHTAIELWFEERDPVSIHALAYAAYEIIHVLSREKGRPRGLLFDSDQIKDEYRREWNALIKKPANFFKHANNDIDDTLEFHPEAADLFITFSVLGLHYCGEDTSDIEEAFLIRLGFERPRFFTEEGRKIYLDPIPVDQLEKIGDGPRHAFLKGWRIGRRLRNQRSG